MKELRMGVKGNREGERKEIGKRGEGGENMT